MRLHLAIFLFACVWALLCYVTGIPAPVGLVLLLATFLSLLMPPVRAIATAKAGPILGVVSGWLLACLTATDLMPVGWDALPHALTGFAFAAGAAGRIASLRGRLPVIGGGIFAAGFVAYLTKIFVELPSGAEWHWWSVPLLVLAAGIAGSASALLVAWQVTAAWHLFGPMPAKEQARPDAKVADIEDLKRAGLSRDL